VRHAVSILLAACAVALLPAQPAEAYRLQPFRWYSHTLAYYDATGSYHAQVKDAARAWNRSGARVRLVAVPRRSARVVVKLDRHLSSAGRASSPVRGGVASSAIVSLRHDLRKGFLSPAAAESGITAVIAHEFGHVLGLNHEDRRCALMNSVLWARCKSAPQYWQHRCRVLEADDVRGVIRRFGGRLRSVGTPFCDSEAAPAAPAPPVATPDPARGSVRLSWQMPAKGFARVRLLRRLGVCPTAADDPAADVLLERRSTAAAQETYEDFPQTLGHYCYAVLALGSLGRPGALAFAAYDHVGRAPAAQFDSFQDAPLQVSFADGSYDPDGSVVAWRWDFGDGTGATDPSPVHTYAAPGQYTVTLTVTDNSGQTGTQSQTVPVS
jgi:hypothetical protein